MPVVHVHVFVYPLCAHSGALFQSKERDQIALLLYYGVSVYDKMVRQMAMKVIWDVYSVFLSYTY